MQNIRENISKIKRQFIHLPSIGILYWPIIAGWTPVRWDLYLLTWDFYRDNGTPHGLAGIRFY